MKTLKEIISRKNEVKKRILTSNYYFGEGYIEAMKEFSILCWVLGEEIEDLDKIKNDYLIGILT